MCTLTYIPIPGKGKIVTANRDESPFRNASSLSKHLSSSGDEYYIAKEPLKGGTNVAISPQNRMSVLLNGAFEAHKMGESYRKSRGILLLESLNYANVFEFVAKNTFKGIEPFTLIEFQENIREIRWDGNKVHKETYDQSQPQIWASAQLYSIEIRKKRQTWFENLLHQNPQGEEVLEFHFNGGDGDPENDLVMNRNGLVQTVSITQLLDYQDQIEIKHYDLVENTKEVLAFPD